MFILSDCARPRNRGHWKRNYIGTLALLGLTVGSGEFMYYPALSVRYEDHYLVLFPPYIILLFFVGIPIFAFEMTMGQYLSVGPVKAFGRLAPILSGYGCGMILVSFVTLVYYNYYLATTLFLLWRHLLFWIEYSGNQSSYEAISMDLCKLAAHASSADIPTSEQEFFWELFWCFLLSWVIVALCLIKGYHASSELIIICQLIPLFILVVLITLYFETDTSEEAVHALTKDVGNITAVQPQKDARSIDIWYDSLRNVSFTLAVSCGGVVTLSSYNTLRHNFIRDSWLIPLANFVIGLLYTILIGKHLNANSDLSYLSIVCSYAKVESIKYIASLLYLMFYFMCLSCQLARVDVIVTAVFDAFNIPGDSKWKRIFTVVSVSTICFLLGISICLNYQNYLIFRKIGERLLMINVSISGIAMPFIFPQFKKIIADLRLEIWECVFNHLVQCWTWITPILIWVIIIWSVVANGIGTPGESAFAIFFPSGLFLALISLITILVCWKTDNNIFLPKGSFCPYKDYRPPIVGTLPMFTGINLPGTPSNTMERRRRCEDDSITDI